MGNNRIWDTFFLRVFVSFQHFYQFKVDIFSASHDFCASIKTSWLRHCVYGWIMTSIFSKSIETQLHLETTFRPLFLHILGLFGPFLNHKPLFDNSHFLTIQVIFGYLCRTYHVRLGLSLVFHPFISTHFLAKESWEVQIPLPFFPKVLELPLDHS